MAYPTELKRLIADILAHHDMPANVDPMDPYEYIPAGNNEHGVMTYVAGRRNLEVAVTQNEDLAFKICEVLDGRGYLK